MVANAPDALITVFANKQAAVRLASFHLSGIVRAPNIARIRSFAANVSHNGAIALVFFKTGTIENA